MLAEDRIPLAHWLAAGLAAVGLHGLLLLALSSSDLAPIGERQGRDGATSRLRIALGTATPAAPAPAAPTAAPSPPSLPASPASPASPAAPPSPVPRRAPETPRPAAAETESPQVPHVAAGPTASTSGERRGTESGSSARARLRGVERSDYFSALHAAVQRVLDYPRRARLDGVEGTVVLLLRIDREGAITKSQVAESSGSRVLDRHALKIARRAAPFGPVPAQLEDEDLVFEIPVDFVLSE